MPGTKIMPLKVFGEDDAYTSDVISAIYYAVENNAQVINMSLGGYEKSELLEEACEAAADAGVLLVAAAGNGGSSAPVYPAAFDCVIGVGATTKENTHYTNSQYGEGVFAVAPGDRICGLRNAANSYCYRSGTSMAAPAVSALGAMAKSINPKMTQNEFKQLLERTSIDLGDEELTAYSAADLLISEKRLRCFLMRKSTITESGKATVPTATAEAAQTRAAAQEPPRSISGAMQRIYAAA